MQDSKALVPSGQRGVVAREEFGAQQTQALAETAATAVAAQAKAAVEARYILALRKPREWEDVRTRLEKECKRSTFAAVARYTKPIGKDKTKWPTGPSIRFAEAALRCMTNVYPETQVIYDDEARRVVQVSVTDLESNLTYSSQVIIAKTVERRFVKDGQEVLGERENSNGDKVFLIRATEDDLLNKQNALVSKALRTNALRLLPGDILDGCMEIVSDTLQAQVRQDPDAAKRKVIDAFADIGVGPVDLAAYVGHPLDRLQPAEITELRQIYTSIRDGETTWQQVMDEREPGGGSAEMQRQVVEEKLRKAEEAKKQTATAETKPATAETHTTEAEPPAEIEQKTETKPAADKPAAKPVFGRRG